MVDQPFTDPICYLQGLVLTLHFTFDPELDNFINSLDRAGAEGFWELGA